MAQITHEVSICLRHGRFKYAYPLSTYTPYGYNDVAAAHALCFTGQVLDSVTGCYLLGGGLRAYSPALMRFINADDWSPFGEGGLSSYAYVSCDPVNFHDPTGHVKYPQKNVRAPTKKSMSSSISPVPKAGASPVESEPSSRSNAASRPTSLPLRRSSVASSTSSAVSSISPSALKTPLRDERAWKLDKSKATFKSSGLNDAEQRSFDSFQNAIYHFGLSPKEAAVLMGGADYKLLDKNSQLYQIRLSGKQRVTFRIQDRQVEIREVGGHT
ncbi:RHS repeat-associated core domain-containing protein [Pseudomonas putida]|uniref:RHS repeat-associated core domain-containing protein n=1 Tax=Pseudomonas putida TaxID=303 RepID=UPI0018AC4E78|nr:RHS repeat-associated core domain-containing protein [Pseudomonas putida]MBF8659896.1 RHS repeat-associated core domain-containing protein [Pseudomonas putida]